MLSVSSVGKILHLIHNGSIIPSSHRGATKLLELGAISVAGSFISCCRNAVDKPIQETIMRHAKYHGGAGGSGTGISGLIRNIDALRTKHERAMFLEVTFSMADMLNVSDSVGKHKDNRPSEIQKMVSTTMNAINNNPFDVDDKSRLYCISSGAPTPTNIVNNVLTAEEIGENVKELFIRERNEKKRSSLNSSRN